MFCVSDAWVKTDSHMTVWLLRTSGSAWYILEALKLFNIFRPSFVFDGPVDGLALIRYYFNDHCPP